MTRLRLRRIPIAFAEAQGMLPSVAATVEVVMDRETMTRLRAEVREVLDDVEQVEVLERSAAGMDAEEIAMEMRTTVERVYCLRARARVRMRRSRR